MRVVTFTVSIDAEEDQWGPEQGEPTVANISAMPGVHQQLVSRGLRPTYFVTQPVAETERAREAMREVAADGRGELGAHLHPWTTRPLLPACGSMLAAIPAALQRAKLRSLTDSLREAFALESPPFRAGRWAFGPETAAALVAEGYRVDSSVMPGVCWSCQDGGVDYTGAYRHVHRFDPGKVGRPTPHGALIEVPVSVGCNRPVHRLWDSVRAHVPKRRPLQRLSSLLHHANAVRKLQLTPEFGAPKDLAATTRALIADGAQHIHVFWHSQSHSPPAHFAKTAADVELLWRRLDAMLDAAHGAAAVQAATVSEVAVRGAREAQAA